MEAMLREEKYSYLAGLNRFRNYLVATQWDMGKRELVGRKVSEAGYVPVRPDVYNLATRQDLLRYLLTLDALEQERAEQAEADLATGRVPDTPENRAMAQVQFQMVSPQQLVAVDFHWSLHHYAHSAFPAVDIWHDVHVLGRRYPIPEVQRLQKVSIPAKRWYPVGAFDRDAPADGLRDYKAELWNRYRHPGRPFSHCEVDGERTVWFEEVESFEVAAEKACAFVTCTYPEMFIESRQHAAIDSARFWLNEEIVQLPAGQAARYQHIAKRGQYFANLMARLNVTPEELDRHLVVEFPNTGNPPARRERPS
jgi:DNA sulfur modification protein DndC